METCRDWGGVPVVSVRHLQRPCEQCGHTRMSVCLWNRTSCLVASPCWTQRFVCVLHRLRQLWQWPCWRVLDLESEGCHSCRGNGKSLLCCGLPVTGALCKRGGFKQTPSDGARPPILCTGCRPSEDHEAVLCEGGQRLRRPFLLY